ncbi:hypothetical protein GCM10023096_32570 [Nonomuraea ferruginea]
MSGRAAHGALSRCVVRRCELPELWPSYTGYTGGPLYDGMIGGCADAAFVNAWAVAWTALN